MSVGNRCQGCGKFQPTSKPLPPEEAMKLEYDGWRFKALCPTCRKEKENG